MLKGSSAFHRASLPWAYPLDKNTLRVVVQIARGLVLTGRAVFGDRYAPSTELVAVPLVKTASDQDFDYFEAEFNLDPPRFRYAFLLNDGIRSFWLHEGGVDWHQPLESFFQYPYINAGDYFDVPLWLTDGVVYQVFPERFARGASSLELANLRPWHDENPARDSFYGGNLEGILERLPYLKDLDITVLYLTPIFASPSNHKYDTTDYYRIDPAFGDEKTLCRLVNACHALGIKVILDAVFNHCGRQFFAFQDVLKQGAESAYATWFHIRGFPLQTESGLNYETFSSGVASMPKLRTENPQVRSYFLDVGRYWIEKCNIDGWRIDVANEVDHTFWREFRAAIKAIKPDAYLVGELWHEGLPWLLGDQFDGITNYPLREACLEFFARGSCDAERFAEAIQRNLYIYAEPMLRASWNLLGSHDTERIMTACAGNIERAALAAIFNLTWLGTPLIYYGEEIGMEGANDPDCRRPMLWEEERWNHDLHRLYKRLIRLRKQEQVLRRGRAAVLHADAAQNTLAYLRYELLSDSKAVIVLNNSSAKRTIDLPEHVPPAVISTVTWYTLRGRGQVEQATGRVVLGRYAALIGLTTQEERT